MRSSLLALPVLAVSWQVLYQQQACAASTISSTFPSRGSNATGARLLAQASPAAVVRDRLERYAMGEFAVASLAGASNLDATVAALEREAPAWIARDPAAKHRRALIAASFALEMAESLAGSARQPLARRLIEWGCQQLRTVDASAAVYRWYLASVALAQRLEDWDLLVNRIAHLKHASAAFPQERRFDLAAAVTAETELWDRRRNLPDPANRGGFGQTAISAADEETARALLDRYRKLAAGSPATIARRGIVNRPGDTSMDDEVTAEAHLRVGILSLCSGDVDGAWHHMASIPSLTRDPHLISLAHMFAGLIAQSRGRGTEAADRYRDALKVAPGSQSVTSLLAALLVTMGRQDEAQDLVQAFFAHIPRASDPWQEYRRGDAHRWPVYLSRLREALQ